MKNFILALIITQLMILASAQNVFAKNDDAKEGTMKALLDYQDEEDDEKDEGDPTLTEAEKPSTRVSHLLVNFVRFTNNYRNTNPKNEYYDTTADARLFSQANFAHNLFVRTYLQLSRVDQLSSTGQITSPQIKSNRPFEDLGLKAQEVVIGYDAKNYTVLGGKSILNFGNAWRWTNGIWINEISENYKQTEKLNLTGVLKVGDSRKTGRYHFGFTSFTNDRGVLDDSIITRSDTSSKSDAVAGDTSTLKSYLLTMDIDFDFANKENLTYHFAYIDMAVNPRNTKVDTAQLDNQKGYVAGMQYQHPLSTRLMIETLLEYSNMKNINGNSNLKQDYHTIGINLKLDDRWSATIAQGRERLIEVNTNGYDRNLAEANIGYGFKKTSWFDKLALQFGYKYRRTNYKNNIQTDQAFGALVRYTKTF